MAHPDIHSHSSASTVVRRQRTYSMSLTPCHSLNFRLNVWQERFVYDDDDTGCGFTSGWTNVLPGIHVHSIRCCQAMVGRDPRWRLQRVADFRFLQGPRKLRACISVQPLLLSGYLLLVCIWSETEQKLCLSGSHAACTITGSHACIPFARSSCLSL